MAVTTTTATRKRTDQSGARIFPRADYAKGVFCVKAWKHFKTITIHRMKVCGGCFRMGLIWQGLTHDLSKYSITEFRQGAKYYQGVRSPNAAEREEKGFSEAWMHHKGRNRHHYEYWTDMSPQTKTYEAVPMPRRYLAEMVADRIAACKVYEGGNYTTESALRYLMRSREKNLMHPQTRQELEFLLTMLRDDGEKATLRYIRRHVLKGAPFPWEEA
jgi:hypothetical protein